MKRVLILLDYDGTLVERTPSQITEKIPFHELEEVQKRYRQDFQIEIEYRIVTSSCARSIEDIMTMSEMQFIQEWIFENGIHVKRYREQSSLVLESDSTRAFQLQRTQILDELGRRLSKELAPKIDSVSEKVCSVAIHCSNHRDEIYQILCEIAGDAAEVIKSGLQTLELFPKNARKILAMTHINKADYSQIYFIGDSIYRNGNDFEIAHHPDIDVAIEVKSARDSSRFLENMKRSIHTQPLSKDILNGTQARVIRDKNNFFKQASHGIFLHKKYILLDFDGTLTFEKGRILPGIIDVLFKLRSDYKIWIITGRSKGWADMMIHTLPIDGVIGENGAFAYYKDLKRDRICYWQSKLVEPDYEQRLDRLKSQIVSQFPYLKFASDQFSREFDLAAVIDEHEDQMTPDQVENLIIWTRQQGAEAVISNIHVNIWFGSYNKAQSVIDLFQEIYGVSSYNLCRNSFYVGDSPNDEPMFRLISASFGVKNIEAIIEKLRYPPAVISDAPEGFGAYDILCSILGQKSIKLKPAIG